jgi:hypothetical protein
MDPITRADLRGFLHTVRQAYIRTGEITAEFTKVLETLTSVADADDAKGLEFAPEPVLTDDEIPF